MCGFGSALLSVQHHGLNVTDNGKDSDALRVSGAAGEQRQRGESVAHVVEE